MTRGRRYGLVVAADRLPPTDPDDAREPVDAALASLRPLVAAQSGAWAPACGRGAGEGVIGVAPPPGADAAALGARLLHSLDHHQPADFPPGWFESYLSVNRRVAAAVASSAAGAATVWVHGHQLQLLPRMLRRLRPDLTIAVQLHCAFPPAETYARLPEHRALLSGLLGADVVALPHPRAVDNLLDLAGRVHGLPVRDDRIAAGHRGVRVVAYPLPADTAAVRRLAASPQVQALAARLRAALRVTGPVLLSVAGWDPADGVEQRLHAFDRFLARHRPAPGTVTLLHVACGQPRTPAEHAQRERTERLIAKINGSHASVGQAVVHYVRSDPDRRDLTALYLACDGMLATPTHHGAVAAAHEFAAAHGDLGATVVTSESSSTSGALPGAIVVNPHDTVAYAEAVARAAGLRGPAPLARDADPPVAPETWAQRLLYAVRARGAALPDAGPLPGPATTGARATRTRRLPAAPGHTRPGGHEPGWLPLAARRAAGR
ncbi:trehalose-6-phosphate synthase [Catellatospora bangladeshensis]|uniref:Glycosyltransferase n=1 Tax=Catellatospora bangladeshensis TaxID=310355 RepID=A0A8J3JIP9_9ACTN|nr:trehalose-6-phosphate synthase [Catellatospora bangladeshensis]GIF85446.1 hypothetical protein Cba03nite_67950 [Catellatospora bangladeshensis]